MASPQKEHGYTTIANEILEHLASVSLTIRELQLVLVVIRKTYGYQKKYDRISLTQFEFAMDCSRPVVSKALKNLLSRHILVRTPLLDISFEKDYEKWLVGAPLLVKNRNNLGRYALTRNGSNAPTHKRKKEIYTKEINPAASTPRDEVDLVLDLFYNTINPNINYGNTTTRNITRWLINKYGFEKITNAVKYAISIQDDRFAPTITTPNQLKDKMAALVKYKQTRQTTKKGTLVL